MSEMSKLEQFMAKVNARPLPQNPMTQVRTMAKELAEGAAAGLWGVGLYGFRGTITDPDVLPYFEGRWQSGGPQIGLLVMNDYLRWDGNTAFITKASFDLIDEAQPTSIFISYRRKDSSAFALLVLARLKMAGLEPFLDLALVPGEDWEAGLRERIRKYDTLIALIGRETLSSEVAIKEIKWALEAGLTLIPIWHNGLVYKADEWKLPAEVDEALQKTHTIRVIEESALGYNNAIVELLNRFGVTP